MLPAIQDGPGEAALTMTDKKADAVVFRGNCSKDLFCTVAAVVVDHENFKRNGRIGQQPAASLQQTRQGLRFAQRGDDELERIRERALVSLID
jgi:hypothetical protein